jgi:hypothetical protein
MPRANDPYDLIARHAKLVDVATRLVEAEYADPENAAAVTIPQLINFLKFFVAYDVAMIYKHAEEPANAGSAIRKYKANFKPPAAATRGGKAHPRSGPKLVDLYAAAGLEDDDADTA